MANIYDMRRYGTMAFLLIAAGLAVLFLCISDNIVKKLAEQERQRMEIWADATKAIANPDAASAYMGYARQDRKAKARDPISAKLVQPHHTGIAHR